MLYSCKLIVWLVIPFLFRFSAVIIGATDRETFVIRYREGEQTIPVTVVLDYTKQTEYVINMNPRSPAKSVTLYDFKQRTIAYKDLTNKECFLGRLMHETMRQESDALQDVTNPVESRPKMLLLYPGRPALSPTEIRNIAGQKTAVFCRKMNTWLVMPEKFHNISKREVDEFEERSYEHHGYHTIQYSHYGRETKRRYRNPSKVDVNDVAQDKEGARKKNFWEPGPSSEHIHDKILPNHAFNAQHSKNQSPEFVTNLNDKENQISKNFILTTVQPSTKNNFRDLHLKHLNNFDGGRNSLATEIHRPSFSARFASHFGPNLSASSTSNHNLNELKFDNISKLRGYTSSHARTGNGIISNYVTAKDHPRTERSTDATEIPDGSYYLNRNHDVVFQTDDYLNKPLSKEFDFDSTNEIRDRHFNSVEREVESESITSQPSYMYNKTSSSKSFPDSNILHDPDVSVNVLEIPRITEKLQNISDHESSSLGTKHLTVPHQNVISHYPVESYPAVEDLSFLISNNIEGENNAPDQNFITTLPSVEGSPLPTLGENQKASFRSNYGHHLPESFNFPTTTSRSGLGSQKNSLHPFDTFEDRQKFSTQATESTEASVLLTTSLPPYTETPRTTVSNAWEADKNKHLLQHSKESATIYAKSDELISSSLTNEHIPPFRRYPTVLQSFKPDQIIIDVENIPTQPPHTRTSSFQQRTTTFNPTVKHISHDLGKINADRRGGLVLGSTQRSRVKPSTNTTKKKTNIYTESSLHSGVSFHVRKNTLHPDQSQFDLRRNQVHHSSRPHHLITNYVQTPDHYPRISHQSRSRFRQIRPQSLPSAWDQRSHLDQYNDLPPGVSIHPRHPQAPYADMVRSNRPPTLPITSGQGIVPKPHRQRHHRKKTHKRINSCCRLPNSSESAQTCCRQGGHCCSRKRKNMDAPCCSGNTNPQTTLPKQPEPPSRVEELQKTDPNISRRCEKERMCRTLYESTQQVMVCRNTNIDGC